jgi:electron transport complex protein RnfG
VNPVVRMALVLAAVCVAAALALAKANDLTKDRIREAQREEFLGALRSVLPPFDNAPDRDTVEAGGTLYYRAKRGGTLTGVGIPVSSPDGYGGPIDALLGVDPEGKVTGVAVLANSETPGLGAKAAKPEYLARFRGKTLRGARWAVKKDGGDFDQITGATITPRALVSAIKRGLEGFEEHRDSVVGAARAK